MGFNINYKLENPWWYVLNDPPNKELDIEDLINLGKKRIEFLKEFSKLKDEFTKKNYNLFNGLLESHFPNVDEPEAKGKVSEDYFLGHWFLRICSVFSKRIESWVIETEGDLFENLFNKISINEKVGIYQKIAGSEKKVCYAKLAQSDLNIPNELITADNLAVHWTLVPYLVSNKKGSLFKGYMVAPFHVFYKSVKKLFEKKLKTSVQILQENDQFSSFFGSNSNISNAIKEIEGQLTNVLRYNSSSILFEDNDFEGYNLYENLDLFPPCMRFLIQDVKETGYIKHNYRFQLGLYLKRIGMDVDTQLRFWYNLAVDNIGISYDLFVRRAGYIIRHIYGLEGSKTDYEVPSCKKIKTDYFCLFSHVNASELKSILPKLYNSPNFKNLKVLEQVLDESKRHTEACSRTFQQQYNKRINITHPLTWIKYSHKFTSNIKNKT